MANKVVFYVVLFFSIAAVTVLYISWADLILNNFQELRLRSPLWGPAMSTVPPTKANPPGLTPIPVLHQTDYNKEPQWDFDDQYRTDRQSHKTTQECGNSLWTRIQEEPELKHKFIPNIRMLVHNGSISMSDWNRLSHFKNPFGFMDYTHPDVMSALNLLQKPKEPLLPPKPGRDCISCAVVANGGVLWRSKKGAEIDQHDYVFRVNGAMINGFEEDVGRRTDVYVHTSFSIHTSLLILKKYKYTAPHDQGIKYVLIPEGMRDFNWLIGLYKRQRLTDASYKYYNGIRPLTYYSGQFNETRFYVLHMDFLRYVKNRFLKSKTLDTKHWHMFRPTNGAFMMFLALQLCDKVNAYGFVTDDHKKYSNYYYERGANTKIIFYINHDYNLEKVLWRRLHDLSIINLYLGEPQEPEPTQGPPKKTQGPPKESKALPKEAKAPPKEAKAPPKEAQAPPKEAKAPPKEAQAPPKEAKAPPKEAKAPPKEAKAPPKEAKAPPKEAKAPPKEAKAPPKEAQAPPKEAKAPPKEAQAPPKEAKAPPKEAKAPPAEAKAPPKEAKAPPKEAKAPPKEAKAPPKEAKAPPKEAQAPPKEAKAPPKEAQAPPKEAKAPLKEAKAPPKEAKAPPKDAQAPLNEAQKSG